MRWLKLRFTIKRLMVLIALVGLTIGAVKAIQSRRLPSIVESQTEASYRQAKLVREVAEYALKEYETGIYQQDRATYQGQMALAESDLARAVDRLKWSTERQRQGKIPPESLIPDQLSKQSADFNLEQARVQLEVLEKYTRARQSKSLQSDIDRARADEQVRLKAWQTERLRRLWWGSGT